MQDQDPAQSLSFCGSPAYLSPEMLLKRGGSKAVDVYGLGTIFYEMLAGFPPFYDNDMKRMFLKITSGRLKIPGYISPVAKRLLKVRTCPHPE